MLAMFFYFYFDYVQSGWQNPSLLKDLFQETIIKTAKNMANIDHYNGDEMRHM